MKKLYIAVIALVGFAVNSYAGVNLGFRGGYVTGNLTPKDCHVRWTIDTAVVMDSTFTDASLIGDSTESKSASGFGGELFCNVGIPGIPLSTELGIGFSSQSLTIDTNSTGSTEATYKISSIKISALGKYVISGVPLISPWVCAGPYLAMNTHSIESIDTTFGSNIDGSMVANFGITGGVGVNLGLLLMPKLSINAGILFDYFLASKGKLTMTDTDSSSGLTSEWIIEPSYSQWNMSVMVGFSYSIL